jgi:hypothetical protein
MSYDPERYTGRNVVERAFNALKQWRALASRYDKHSQTYRGGVVLAAILTWLCTTCEARPTRRTRRGVAVRGRG